MLGHGLRAQPAPDTGRRADVVILGGGVGGCAAALAACRAGRSVVLVEPTDWIGGQLTSQAVPPDEHPWIESFGCTRSYREFRDGVRRYYREQYPLTPEARANPRLNPGNGMVSRLCHEPGVALAVLHQMLAPHVSGGRLQIWTRHV
ncbi:MAG: FAD-dependent oxidoreductase, partial [Verrucomicrobiae bacterium]|nr:FAD-dependent oxidoreductase [Verrucomicrobiae bacterium]